VSPFLHRMLHKLWYVGASFVILAALLVSITTLLTPILDEHRLDFEKLASSILKTPVVIGNVKVSWHGYSPEIDLEKVSILDEATQKPKIVMSRLRLDFSIWQSLWKRQIFVDNIIVSGAKITITEDAAFSFF